MMAGGSSSPKTVKAQYHAVEHAQKLALSSSDLEAERRAMQQANAEAQEAQQMSAREAAAHVLNSG